MINIVSEQPGWVTHRIAATLARHIPDSKLSFEACEDADANVYIPYYMVRKKTRRDVPWFTHYQKDRDHIWRGVSELADICLAQCHTTKRRLPKDKARLWQPPPDPQFTLDRPIKIGVCGREYPRKRSELINLITEIPGIEVHQTRGELEFEDMPAWYSSVDYILVLSDNEGGPMCVPEAIAMGKPVIAPDVGWCWQYPVIKYRSVPDLLAKVAKLGNQEQAWRDAARQVEALCSVS